MSGGWLPKARRWSYLLSRTLGDVQAVRRGRIVERVWNRWYGRKVDQLVRKGRL